MWLAGVGGAVAGAAVTFLSARLRRQSAVAETEKELETLREQARLDAENIRKQGELEAKEELLKAREAQEKRFEKERSKVRNRQEEVEKRERASGDRDRAHEKRQRLLSEVESTVAKRQEEVREREKELNALVAEERDLVARAANMTESEARDALMNRIRRDIADEEERMVAKAVEQTRANAEEKARDILSTSIQRVAASHSSDVTVSVVDLPNDDVKGRIIGREGRNIRAFEKAAGVDVVVDDTPGVVVVSAFDGVRRETARRSLVKLVKDGRIHPAKIEEVVRSTKAEMEDHLNETGRRAVLELNMGSLHPKLVHLLGRLKYRTSYGQNVLQHSLETANLMATMAGEMGLDAKLAKRCGLLHDVGKAVDHEVEGGHPAIGAEMARRCGEDQIVVNAIAAHHEDVRMETAYAVLTAAADAVSAARPGARRDTLERYIQRLQKLEEICMRYEGVQQAYAIQAGREVRVMVNPNRIGDRTSQRLAREIARAVENELTYPGEVKVTVLREVRVTDYAR